MKIIFVCGPTACGKSALAMRLAKQYQGAIINCDSVQVYQNLRIGSAQPSEQDKTEVPHYLFDYVPMGKELTAGEFSRDFFQKTEELKGQFPYLFAVGGSGFYIQALIKGMFDVGASDLKLREAIEAEDSKDLYQELLARDPETAKRIHENDHFRLARAIELLRTHQKPLSQIKKETEDREISFPYPFSQITIEASKEELLPRVQLRTEQMIKDGLVSEVQAVIAKGFKDWAPLRSVGYKETVDWLSANDNDLKAMIVQSTMKLTKKQRTWFNAKKDWEDKTQRISLAQSQNETITC